MLIFSGMSLDVIEFPEEIEKIPITQERAKYTLDLYSKLISGKIREKDEQYIETAAGIVQKYLSPLHAERIIQDYKLWRALASVKEGKLNPASIDGQLMLGMERGVFTLEELQEAQSSYQNSQNKDSKSSGEEITQYVYKK